MKKFLIGSIVLIVLIIIIAITYPGLYPSPKTKVKTLSNVTELYSLFTPYMKTQINSRLQSIECQPTKYYYNDSSVCFVCNEIDACFGYSWVNRTGDKKMNPKCTSFLSGKYSKEDKLNFCSCGIARLLDCSCNEVCNCKQGMEVSLTDGFVSFTFPMNVDLKEKIEQITGEKCDIIESGKGLLHIHCENFKGYIFNESNRLAFRCW